ncbi:MAG: archaeosortase/exosortase family protein [Flavobacteriales bacterium]|jgi:exosortase family protein XrtF|nr:archaeosortase/exosortase family protein [Flavobacteriales bacterium]
MPALPTPSVAKPDPFVRFLLVAALSYGGWYLLYEGVLHPHGALDRALIDNLAWLSGGLLEAMGHELLPAPVQDNNRYIGIQGGHHLWIGDACNGAGLFAVFLIFLLAYPGPWKHKGWFAVLGLASIHLINAVRIAALCVIVSIDYELLTFNHDYTFYVVVYGWVFLLWYIWVKRFAPRKA